MKKSKAISLLMSFSKEELKDFGLVVKSPYFTREKIHLRLFDILKKYHPLYPENKVEKKKIYRLLYPDREYNDGAMKNIISDFLKLETDYLRIKGMRSDNFYNEHFLMKELIKRNEPVLFGKTRKKTEVFLNSTYKNQTYFLNNILMDEITENFYTKIHDRFISPEFEKSLLENSLLYTILQILYFNSKILNTNKLVKEIKNETIFDEEVSGFLEGKGAVYLKQVYINSHYLMYKLLKTGNEKYFFELKKILTTRHIEIEKFTLRTLFTSIENYAVGKINSGILDFYRELFFIYRFMTEQKLYSGSFGHMRHIFYLNTVSIGLEAGEMKWTEKFINDYKNEVYDEFRESSYNLASAILCYWKKDFENAFRLASKIQQDDFAFKINIRSLYLKIYFDLNETESFYSHIDAMKQFYTKSKQVPGNFRKLLPDYVNYTKLLFNIKNGLSNEKTDLVKIKREITGNKSLMNKTWLLRKVIELETK